MVVLSITSKGQIVIPADIRKHFDLGKGKKLYIEERKDEIVLKPLTMEYFDSIAGVLKTRGKLSKKLLAERAKQKKKEEKR